MKQISSYIIMHKVVNDVKGRMSLFSTIVRLYDKEIQGDARPSACRWDDRYDSEHSLQIKSQGYMDAS